ETYDNRYNLSASDLPDAGALRANGIRRVIYVVDDAAETRREEDDLHTAFVAWDAAGIGISLMDLGMLAGPAPDGWDALCASRVLDVEPRVTIFSGPSFYVRARGGFGGEHARPSGVGVSLGNWGGAWGARGGGG
ncbi:MAG TPA: hypothetical protein VKU41_20305, partial [Polyangiaceae bacterium]|nr:hypothetical protein [Polyangiaceae bacterium]